LAVQPEAGGDGGRFEEEASGEHVAELGLSGVRVRGQFTRLKSGWGLGEGGGIEW
jgi:hypothetical protein